MNYQKVYDQLVEKCKPRGLDKSKLEGYYEIHHIVPRCMGGSDEKDNLVMFTGREHFIAHMLLWKGYPEEVSLMRAAHIMSSRWTNETVGGSGDGINSKVYAKLREEYAIAVSNQCSGENNPMYGVTHSPDILAKIKVSRRKTERRKSLKNWKINNKKYMSQFERKRIDIQPFLINVGSQFPTFRIKGELKHWLSFNVLRDFWERCGRPGAKDFATQLMKFTDEEFNTAYFKTMVERFLKEENLSNNPDFVVKALNNNVDEYIESLEASLVKTFKEIREEYFQKWVENRDSHREVISKYLEDNSITKHKNNSMAKLSLVDVVEACLLWKTGKVGQKQIAALYGVARNSVSNALEAEGRWISARKAADELREIYFDK